MPSNRCQRWGPPRARHQHQGLHTTGLFRSNHPGKLCQTRPVGSDESALCDDATGTVPDGVVKRVRGPPCTASFIVPRTRSVWVHSALFSNGIPFSRRSAIHAQSSVASRTPPCALERNVLTQSKQHKPTPTAPFLQPKNYAVWRKSGQRQRAEIALGTDGFNQIIPSARELLCNHAVVAQARTRGSPRGKCGRPALRLNQGPTLPPNTRSTN